MKEITYENERQERNRYEGFTDEMMMYAFIHQEKYDDPTKGISEKTKVEYVRDLIFFYRHVQENEDFLREDILHWKEGSLFNNLKPRHIESFQEHLSTIYKASTRSRKNVVIKSFFTWLYNKRYLDYPLHADFKKSTVNHKDRPKRDLNEHEFKELLEVYKDHPINYAILLLLGTTGLRVSEILSPSWGDLYYDSRIHGGHFFLKTIGKNDYERHALIKPKTLRALQAFRVRRGLSPDIDPHDTTPLLVTGKLKRYSSKYMSNYVKRIVSNSECDWLEYKEGNVTPHWLRHFYVSFSEMHGASTRDIMKAVGHKQQATTEIYLEDRTKKKEEVALKWDDDYFE